MYLDDTRHSRYRELCLGSLCSRHIVALFCDVPDAGVYPASERSRCWFYNVPIFVTYNSLMLSPSNDALVWPQTLPLCGSRGSIVDLATWSTHPLTPGHNPGSVSAPFLDPSQF